MTPTNKPPAAKTDVAEFVKFHGLLMSTAPEGYVPWYVALRSNVKDSAGLGSWKKDFKTFEEARFLMSQGLNIGLAATPEDALAIVDVDDMKAMGTLKPTLQTISSKRFGRHYYYFLENNAIEKVNAKIPAGEWKANWSFCVVPGSFVTPTAEKMCKIPAIEKRNAGKYTIANAVAPVTTTIEELPEALRVKYYSELEAEFESQAKREARCEWVPGEFSGSKSELFSITFEDITGLPDSPKRVPMPTEIHGSDTGHNCSVSQGFLHCWRHNVFHTPFTYLAVAAGVCSCEEAGKPHNSARPFGVTPSDGDTLLRVWLFAKENGYISQDDYVPAKAALHYVLSQGLCTEDELEDGWRLPERVFKLVITALHGM